MSTIHKTQDSSYNTVLFQNALISVSDKTNLVDFIFPLAQKGMRVVSTGGTAQKLKQAGIEVVEVSQQTACAEVMDGRVKSLHPHIYIPILSRLNNKEDNKILKEANLCPFDLVVCNLYPFEKNLQTEEKNLIKWIDVGGPSLLRAAAKNFERVTVLCDPADYLKILDQNRLPNLQERRQLAAKVFNLLFHYDKVIADWMKQKTSQSDMNLKGTFFKKLSYGENPDQKANWFSIQKTGLHQGILLQGKALSFNNICDLDSAVSVVREFSDFCCAVAIKHNNPCGVAYDSNNIEKAIDLTLKADPMSVFGGVIAVNRSISYKAANLLCSLFLETVIAPHYTDEALEVFKSKKKNLRIVQWPTLLDKNKTQFKLRGIDGGFLAQDTQKIDYIWPSHWQCTLQKPDLSTQAELLMAWKVCAFLKSNAISLVSKTQTIGLGMGQVNRISAVNLAIQNWKNHHPHIMTPVLASDGFFPFADSIEMAYKVGIKWIIQPGGSIKDKQVISKSQDLGINMILTGKRCFLH